MKSEDKPKYKMLDNIRWMAGIAWNTRKRVMAFCILTAVLEVLGQVTRLYLAAGGSG